MLISTKKKKNTDKFWVALSVAPNCKDIQCPFTVEGINGGKITQWNIDLGGGEETTQMIQTRLSQT